jgi:PPK2 family polyphosphate:nucleotide phosphotransferase
MSEVSQLEARLLAPRGKAGGLDLDAVATASTLGISKKKAARKLAEDREKLETLQYRLYAENKRSVLIVLQAMDTGGKDGAIRKVFCGLNPQGVLIQSFKKPTDEERAHHYLWRIEKALPKPGIITVFNRSHYEDILVPTVLNTHEHARIEKRYAEINAFEKKLAEGGTLVLKFFLHISKAEQKRRLQERLDVREKNWKWGQDDLKMRALWEDFQGAYGKILARTNKPWAPWYVIPADNKWFRDYALGHILRRAVKKLDPKFPPAPSGLDKIVIPD